jgi:putative membrane protein
MRITTALAAVVLLAPASPSLAQAPTDAQIAAIVVTANQVDIDAGELARERSRHAGVRSFAESMVAAHTAVNEQAKALVTKLGVTPEENATSRALKAGGDRNAAYLKTLDGAAFDRAYIDHEVAYHAQVLEALDQTLIPSARHPELKDLLVAVRPAFVAHLDHAKTLQEELSR